MSESEAKRPAGEPQTFPDVDNAFPVSDLGGAMGPDGPFLNLDGNPAERSYPRPDEPNGYTGPDGPSRGDFGPAC